MITKVWLLLGTCLVVAILTSTSSHNQDSLRNIQLPSKLQRVKDLTQESLLHAYASINLKPTSTWAFEDEKTPAEIYQSQPYSLQAQDVHDILASPFPSKIWQSWKDDSQDPTPRTQGFPHLWRAKNPDWRYERLTDGNCLAFVHEELPSEISKLFDDLDDAILRADLLRYLIMFTQGGVWSDIDTLPVRPVSEWIPEKYRDQANVVIGIENDHRGRPIFAGVPYSIQFAQYTMFAKPGHPFFARVIQRVCENLRRIVDEEMAWASSGVNKNAARLKGRLSRRFDYGRIKFEDVMANTGPLVFTEVLFEYLETVTGTYDNGTALTRLKEAKLLGDVLILPKRAFGWLAYEHKQDGDEEGVLVKHIFQGSWRESHPE